MNTYAHCTSAVETLLKEMNASKGLDLEIDPAWNCPILDAHDINVGYKIHRKTGQTRIMSLAVNTFSGFEQLPDGKMGLTAPAKEQIVEAVEKFWSKGNTEQHVAIDIH